MLVPEVKACNVAGSEQVQEVGRKSRPAKDLELVRSALHGEVDPTHHQRIEDGSGDDLRFQSAIQIEDGVHKDQTRAATGELQRGRLQVEARRPCQGGIVPLCAQADAVAVHFLLPLQTMKEEIAGLCVGRGYGLHRGAKESVAHLFFARPPQRGRDLYRRRLYHADEQVQAALSRPEEDYGLAALQTVEHHPILTGLRPADCGVENYDVRHIRNEKRARLFEVNLDAPGGIFGNLGRRQPSGGKHHQPGRCQHTASQAV